MPQFINLPIQTPRLLLRPLQVLDADALLAIFSDPEVMRYWATAPWTSRNQALDRIEKDAVCFSEGSALRLALQPASGGEILGTVSLFAFNEQSQRAEIGYILARKAWGNGLMHEALSALVTYALESLKLRRLEADIDPRNERSARSLERLGFTREGVLRERWVVEGEVSDTALYGMLSREWVQARTNSCSQT